MRIIFSNKLTDEFTILYVETDAGEEMHLGEIIDIPLTDGNTAAARIIAVAPESYKLFDKTEVEQILQMTPEKLQTSVPCSANVPEDTGANIVICGIGFDTVKTEYGCSENRPDITITPYKELRLGKKSIYDYVQPGYTVPPKVIAYLQTKEPSLMSPGIYTHPFKPEKHLLGPYTYTDGLYRWDRDTWKYVLKYGLTLPQSFIDHVMSDEGTEFLKKCGTKSDFWYNKIEELEAGAPHLNLLPKDGGDIPLDDF